MSGPNTINEDRTTSSGISERQEKKRLPQPVRGVLNFLNEESAAAREDYKKVNKLRNNPKY